MGGSAPRPVSGVARALHAAFTGHLPDRDHAAAKVVLAYYKRIPDGDFLPLMSAAARERVKLAAQTQNVHAYGLPVIPGRIDRILVQALAYTPQAENIPYVDAGGNTYFGAIVHVEFFYTPKNDPKQEKRMHSVNWFVIRENGNWRLDHVEP